MSGKGYKEVVLTGIHLSSYGVDFPEEKKETLLSLIRAVHEIEGIRRIRLGSLEPGIVTREFAEGIAALPKVCPHFHLSLQSGCDETLERMNRRYRSGEYRERCELLREVYGNPALTTDVIVGFPQDRRKNSGNPMILWTASVFTRLISSNIPEDREQRRLPWTDS